MITSNCELETKRRADGWKAWYLEAVPVAEHRYERYLKGRKAEGGAAVNGYPRWSEIRGELVERAGGEDVVAAGRQELMAQVIGRRLAELRRPRGPENGARC